MSSSSSSTSAPTVSSPSPVQLHTFPTALSLKLTDDNFLVWSQQVLAQVEGLNLLSFLESPLTPSRFLFGTTVNPAFLLHKQQDNLLVAWLLASMSPSMLTQMVGLRFAYLTWDKLNVYYASHTRAKIRKLKLLLKTPKRDRSISTYLLDIKKVVDSLAATGSAITAEDHIDAVLDGLPEEYDAFITSITSQLDPYTIEDIESLPFAQE